MKRYTGFAVAALALLLCPGTVWSADIDTGAGAKSLVFDWSGLSNLDIGGYRGPFGVAVRYFVNDGMAIRPGVRFDFSSREDKEEDTKESAMTFGISAVLEKHSDIGIPSIFPWMGAGVGIEFETSKDETDTSETKTTGFAFGLSGELGFEWSFADGVTLGGAYNIGLGFASEKTEVDVQGLPTETVSDISGFSLGFRTANLHLTVAI